MKKFVFSAAFVAAFSAQPVAAHDGEKPRIDDHAPIGVMADHYHKKGEWMASARWMSMGMGDPANTMMGPQEMDGNMVMIGGMYAPSDKLTIAAGISYVDRSMEMVMMGHEIERSADGIGDMRVMAITPVFDDGNQRLLFSIGGSIPTGDTSETDAMGNLVPLTMQPGNGGWSIRPGATYSLFGDGWSFGLQAAGTFWLDGDDTGAKAGDSWHLTGWGSLTVNDRFSLSGRLAYEDMNRWRGVPAFAGSPRERLRGFVGANFYVVGTHRLGIEVGLPLSESRGANNLETGTTVIVGWQKSF